MEAVSGHTATVAFDAISEHGSTIALARALAKVSPAEGQKKAKITHLLPLDEDTKKQIPESVETIETYVGSAHGKDEACKYFLPK